MQPEPTAKSGGAGSALGALPDGLLPAVLSFLRPRRPCGRACCRGGGGTCIHMDELEFGITPRIGQDVTEEKWRKFEDFTTNLLLFRDSTSSLDKFRVHAHVHNHRDVDRWIRCGIKYCPRVLDRSFDVALGC